MLASASKWHAAIFLLDAFDDEDLRARATAVALLSARVSAYNRSGAQQLDRLRWLLTEHADDLEERLAHLLSAATQHR